MSTEMKTHILPRLKVAIKHAVQYTKNVGFVTIYVSNILRNSFVQVTYFDVQMNNTRYITHTFEKGDMTNLYLMRENVRAIMRTVRRAQFSNVHGLACR
jgi:hypothetical protein